MTALTKAKIAKLPAPEVAERLEIIEASIGELDRLMEPYKRKLKAAYETRARLLQRTHTLNGDDFAYLLNHPDAYEQTTAYMDKEFGQYKWENVVRRTGMYHMNTGQQIMQVDVRADATQEQLEHIAKFLTETVFPALKTWGLDDGHPEGYKSVDVTTRNPEFGTGKLSLRPDGKWETGEVRYGHYHAKMEFDDLLVALESIKVTKEIAGDDDPEAF